MFSAALHNIDARCLDAGVSQYVRKFGQILLYIVESPGKQSYLLLKISTKKRYVEEEILVNTADQLAEVLFSEVSMDVLQMTGNNHTEQTADPLELAEIKRRWNPFLERLPEYQTVCEKILAGEK